MKRARFEIPDRDPNRPKVPEVVALADAYYERPGNGAGGNCHVVLDDGNLNNSSILFCIENCVAHSDDLGADIMRRMLAMTGSQRRRVYGRRGRFGSLSG